MDVSLYFLYPVPILGKSFHTPYLSSMADFHDGVAVWMVAITSSHWLWNLSSDSVFRF